VRATKIALAAKIGGALVAAGIVAGGVWVVHDRSGATPSVPPPQTQVAVPTPPPEPVHEIAPDAPPTSLALPEPPTPHHDDGDGNAEAALVQAAQAALLRDDAADALALTRRHAARFASGAHAEERDRIAIEALVRLGRLDDARAQAQKF